MKYNLKIERIIYIHETPKQQIAYTECHGRVVSTPTIYSEDPAFKSWSANWLS